ncbi:FkbM family methyltransferase [Bradyrhizobium sp.]|uniref:FkbM family methyltransferase n=1 Tax=Bradyrhizobium sp. TaxID=376 RepID=UPI003BB17AE2
MLRKIIVGSIEKIMGTESLSSISESIAKIGLRGLGVNIDHGIESGGEDRLLARLFNTTKGMACFDVGGNVGDCTAALLDKGASKVAVFELAREPFDRIQTRFRSDPRVSVFQTALGEKIGAVEFYEAVEESDSVLATRDANIIPGSLDRFVKHEVKMSVDAICKELGYWPQFMKIDVEGFELEVLSGAPDLLASGILSYVQFEFGPHHLKRRQNISDFMAVLKNFQFYRLATHALRPLGDGSHYLHNIYAYSNIVCVRRGIVLANA